MQTKDKIKNLKYSIKLLTEALDFLNYLGVMDEFIPKRILTLKAVLSSLEDQTQQEQQPKE